MRTERLRIENGQAQGSTFGGLDGLYLHLLEGQMLGVLFDNIHSKEAFVQLMQGDIGLSDGRMYLEENLATDAQTIAAKVHVLHKKAALAGSLSICENVYYAQLPSAFLGIGIYEEMLGDLLEQFGLPFPIHQPVDTLTHVQAVSVELLKAFALKKRIVVLGDITSYLSPSEITEIQKIIQKMREKGYAFLVVESFWNLVLRMCDSIAVIRGGRTAGYFSPTELDNTRMQQLFQQMAQQPLPGEQETHRSLPEIPEGTALSFEDVTTDVLQGVTFSLPRGKLLHIQCLDGQSYEELIATLRGERKLRRGTIRVLERPIRAEALRNVKKSGLCIMEDSPHARVVLHHMTVFDNIAFSLSQKIHFLWLRASYQQSLRREAAAICGEDLWTRNLRALTPVQLQKVAYCKWMIYRPNVLVCLNPFTGMDYQIDGVTEKMIREMQRRNIAVLIVTSYLPITSLEGETCFMQEGKLIPFSYSKLT